MVEGWDVFLIAEGLDCLSDRGRIGTGLGAFLIAEGLDCLSDSRSFIPEDCVILGNNKE